VRAHLLSAAAAAGLTAALVGVLAVACGPATGEKAGMQCFQSIDCAMGLACVPMGSIRVCSNNVTALESREDAGMEAQAPPGTPPPGIYPDADVDGGEPGDTGSPAMDATAADAPASQG